MAVMKIKNKYEVSFRELVEATEKKGGLPKEIVVTVQEAKEIIDEMGASSGGKPDTSFHVTFPNNDGQPYDFRMGKMLWEGNLDDARMFEVLNAWYKKEFVVKYDNIPVRIEPQKKTPPPPTEYANKPTIPENESIRWWQSLFKRNRDGNNDN